MADLKDKLTELAQLMTEFGLEEARLSGEDWSIEYSRREPSSATMVATVAEPSDVVAPAERKPRPKASSPAAQPAAPQGIPVNSPMMGIYYAAPSPGAPPFVKEGEQVAVGQVVGLIEAMKVFNEISATVAGTVLRVTAESGALVQPGDPLLYIG